MSRVSCLVSRVSCFLLVALPLSAWAGAEGDDEAPPPPTEAVARGAAPTLADLQRATDAATAAAQAARDAVALVKGAGVSGSPQSPPPVPSFAAALAPAKAPPEPAPQPQPVTAAVVAAPATPASVVTVPAQQFLIRQAAPTVVLTEAPPPTVLIAREAAPPPAAPAQVVYVREAASTAPVQPVERVVYVRESPARPVVATARGTALVPPCCVRRVAGRVGEALSRMGQPRTRSVALVTEAPPRYVEESSAYEEPPPPAPVYSARPLPKSRPVVGLPPLPSAQR